MLGVIGAAVTAFGLLIRFGVVSFAGWGEEARTTQLVCGGLCTLLGLVLVGSALAGLRAGRVMVERPNRHVDHHASAADPFDLSRLGIYPPQGGRGRHDAVDV